MMTSVDYWYLVFAAFGLVCAWAVVKGLDSE